MVYFMEHSIKAIHEKEQAAVAKRYGYELSDHTMVLYGLCADCRKKSAG